jgi:hypothetical protein
VGHAAEAWGRLSDMLESGNVDGVPELYAVDALYLEPYNPPHRGNLLIEAYLKDWLAGKDDVAIDAKRVIEGDDGTASGSSGRSPTPPPAAAGTTCRGRASSRSPTTGGSATTATTPERRPSGRGSGRRPVAASAIRAGSLGAPFVVGTRT